MFKVIWDASTEKDLAKLHEAKKLIQKVDLYLTQYPSKLGKALTGKYKGLFRYRFGDYRIIYEIDEKNNLVIITKVGHRSKIYD